MKRGCLGKLGACSRCSGKLIGETFVIGLYCLDGWREQARHANMFFINMDGSPSPVIGNEEKWAQQQYSKQQKALREAKW